MIRIPKVMQIDLRRAEATPDDMKKINALSRVPLGPHEVYVGETELANDLVDRTFERFPPAMLRQFADTAPAKSLMPGHDYRALPLGLFHAAKVRRDDGQNTLVARFYIVKTAQNEHDRAQIDGGVWRYASIGFTAEDLVCDLCGASMYGINGKLCSHRPGQKYTVKGDDGTEQEQVATYSYTGKGEMVEGSIVYLGAQWGAEIKSPVEGEVAPEIAVAQREAELALAVHHAMIFAKSEDGAGILYPRWREAVKADADEEAEPIGEKPYPNFHACRLRDPGDFQADSFRRTTRDHEGKEYSVIMGKLDGETTMTEQAYRYAKGTWEADEARLHCESHDGSFEAASGAAAEEEADKVLLLDEAAVAKAIAEMKVGRVLSKANENLIRAAAEGLQKVLASLDKEQAEETPLAEAPKIEEQPEIKESLVTPLIEETPASGPEPDPLTRRIKERAELALVLRRR